MMKWWTSRCAGAMNQPKASSSGWSPPLIPRPAVAANARVPGWGTAVHFTETWDEQEQSSHVITQETTTAATTPDGPMLSPILDDLRQQDLVQATANAFRVCARAAQPYRST